MFTKVVVANRGAVAARVLRALRTLRVRSVAVYSDADAGAPYLEEADEAVAIGPSAPAESYLNEDRILGVVRETGADALHPGYGFLAENAGFARRLEDAGARLVGPSPRWIEAMGHKTRARQMMAERGLSVGAGSGVLPGDASAILAAARRIGYPVLVKPAAGGGGIGMLVARDEAALLRAVERSRSMAERSFASGEIYLERLVESGRHVEFQVLADRSGHVRHLFERDCSVQRRYQKIVEEAPAPGLDRARVDAYAGRVAATLEALGYDGIGTVETLRGPDGEYSFLEVNTRLQVEHGVTEEVTGIDLVASQIRVAAGEPLDSVLPEAVRLVGHAVEARVYAEDPKRFLPSPGRLTVFRPPRDRAIRVETGYREGRDVTPFYDPLLAKVIARGATRPEAIGRLGDALRAFEVSGVKTNIPALIAILGSEAFRSGAIHTGLVGEVLV